MDAPHGCGYWPERRWDMVTKDAKDQVSLLADVDSPVVLLNCSLMLPFEGRYCCGTGEELVIGIGFGGGLGMEGKGGSNKPEQL